MKVHILQLYVWFRRRNAFAREGSQSFPRANKKTVFPLWMLIDLSKIISVFFSACSFIMTHEKSRRRFMGRKRRGMRGFLGEFAESKGVGVGVESNKKRWIPHMYRLQKQCKNVVIFYLCQTCTCIFSQEWYYITDLI